ncbi:MAG: primosomal protein N' [Butyrivibrio sp.]|nr:primosomal protein N' [Butyrivibrio sp.]
MKYAGVIVDISHEKLDKTFQYIIPRELEESVGIGTRVNIPFGKSRRTGYVVEITDKPELDADRLKAIESVARGSVPIDERMIKLAYWIKTNYGSTIIKALQTVIPVKDKVKNAVRRTVSLAIPNEEAARLAEECRIKRRSAQARLLDALIEYGSADYSFLTGKLSISAQTLKSLNEKKVVSIEETVLLRGIAGTRSENPVIHELNPEQRSVSDALISDYDKGDMTPCLIKGVTGSGKTEIYMELIEHIINRGREAIVLIPEIALTYQTVMRFYNRFGDVVSVINSRLSNGEKYDRFCMAREGRIKIMIGPRSALFTPFKNIGLIIIDEEHENAYQSENIPKYHARETAIELARMTGAKVVMGSATPSLESYYRAKNGEYKLCRLDSRAGAGRLPEVEIVDLREELRKGNRTMFSDRLTELIEDRLKKNEQIMLFLNRRGYRGFINCRDCGEVIECPHCAVSLTLHNNNRLKCHYCGYERENTESCPKCGSKHIGAFKAGTQQAEAELHKYFPAAVTLRMDADTTKGKEGHDKILREFAAKKADILLGTQMIVKGHDFPDVTLVGALLADGSLYSTDYRSAENTFELLTQAAGRAGRGIGRGSVVIQTYNPDNYSIVHAVRQDYDSFYEEEISYRALMEYPPVSHMMSVRISSPKEAEAAKLSRLVAEAVRTAENFGDTRVIGPADAVINKINDIYHKMIYYKNKSREDLSRIKDYIEAFIKNNQDKFKSCLVQFEFR